LKHISKIKSIYKAPLQNHKRADPLKVMAANRNPHVEYRREGFIIVTNNSLKSYIHV